MNPWGALVGGGAENNQHRGARNFPELMPDQPRGSRFMDSHIKVGGDDRNRPTCDNQTEEPEGSGSSPAPRG